MPVAAPPEIPPVSSRADLLRERQWYGDGSRAAQGEGESSGMDPQLCPSLTLGCGTGQLGWALCTSGMSVCREPRGTPQKASRPGFTPPHSQTLPLPRVLKGGYKGKSQRGRFRFAETKGRWRCRSPGSGWVPTEPHGEQGQSGAKPWLSPCLQLLGSRCF